MRTTKKLIGLGLILMLIGGALFLVEFFASDFDIYSMSNAEMVETTEEINASTLKIKVNTSDVNFVFDEAATAIRVTYTEKFNNKNEALTDVQVSVSDGVATIDEKKTGLKTYVTMWEFKTPKMTFVIPKGLSIDASIITNTGDVVISGEASFKNLTIETDTGDVTANLFKLCASEAIKITTDTGDVKLGELSATNLGITTNTGNVKLEKFNTASATVVTDTGDIVIKDSYATEFIKLTADTDSIKIVSTMTTKTLIIELDTADLKAENALIDAEQINIVSDTGDVEARLAGSKSDYKISVESDTGSSNVKDALDGGTRILVIKTDTGDSRIYFEK